jgi:serine/threonine protein kinase
MASTGPIDELLLRWEELRQQGRGISAEELCRDCPELLDQLRREIRVLEAVYRVPNGLDLDRQTLADGRRDAQPETPSLQIGGYEIVGELGRGGMGVVFKAWQTQLKRFVALKMILARAHAGPAELARFRREAEAVARLQHPNIVQVYEIGEQDGCPYLTLEYVAGGSLAEHLDGRSLAPEPAARLVETLARAVHYAHQRGIIHRDLKPANILLDCRLPIADCRLKEEETGVPSSSIGNRQSAIGNLKITDFGLAKRIDDAPVSTRGNLTGTGSILGSPSYMAPEQAIGQSKAIGPAADIYALGAILYEVLTGRPPFVGATLLETLEKVRSEDPVPPRSLQPGVPADLETICLQCLQKDPGRRYASAHDLANDLSRFLRGDLIRARSFGLLGRWRHALSHSEFDVRFRALSQIVLLATPLPLLEMVILTALTRQGLLPAVSFLLVPPTVTGIVLGVLYWYSRRRALLPAGNAERQFWSIWLGHWVTLVLAVAAWYLLDSPGRPLDVLVVYPFWALSLGQTFFTLGTSFWGRFYLMGTAFFVLACLMPLRLEWAPVAVGLLLSLTLLLISLRLRRLAS